MGFRFRKSLRLFPGVRLNLSKSGISTSLGGPGATINIGPKGTRHTVGLPGSGLSFSSYAPHNKAGDGASEGSGEGAKPTKGAGCGCLAIVLIAIAAIGQCSSFDQTAVTPNALVEQKAASLLPPPSGDALEYSTDETVYVTATNLNARSGPSVDAPIIDSLAKGTSARVVGRSGEWLQVAQGAALVWIAASHVSSRLPVQSLMTSTPRGSSSLASRPNRQHTGACPCGSRQVCIGPRGGRYCITSGGGKRYGV